MKQAWKWTLSLLFMPAALMAQSTDVNELPPLDELGEGKFMGYTGGLYPEGRNIMPAGFFIEAVNISRSIQPLNKQGSPDPNGQIGVVAIGASTVAMFGDALGKMIYDVPGIRPEIVYVNGGIGGQDLNKIHDPMARYWLEVDKRVQLAGLTNEQVQVAWMQEDDLRNTTAKFPDRADMLADAFTYAAQQLKIRYPNLQLLYFTGRHTTEYMPADAKVKHMEPRAYLNGWGTKFVIERQINGDPELSFKGPDAKAPLLLWGPYFWTQGEKPRADGYTFTKDLVNADGVHPNASGEVKVARDILDFWQQDPVSVQWLTGGEAVADDPSSGFLVKYLNDVLAEIPHSRLSGDVLLLLLKDAEVRMKSSANGQDGYISFPRLDDGMYTWVLVDQGDFIQRGDFLIKDGQQVFRKEESPEKDTSVDEVRDDRSAYVSKNDVPEDQPAWFLNGSNKLPKLIRLLGGDKWAKAVFTTPDGEVVLVVEDVLHKHTRVNDILPPGNYILKFYDENGDQINVDREIPEYLRLK
ncbi:MAG: hypothetical protein H6548_00150 [Chitinophagales bacterium]|nr:hypothetical protein [Chitinophagales bacterium]